MTEREADQKPMTASELETLREGQDRALHVEGIPMFLALTDERTTAGPTEPGEGGQHTAVVERMDHYRQSLAAAQRDDDMGVVISIITAAAYEDFDASVFP